MHGIQLGRTTPCSRRAERRARLMAGRLGREDTKVSDDTPYAAERIREIWSKLSKDKRRFLDVLLHAVARTPAGLSGR